MGINQFSDIVHEDYPRHIRNKHYSYRNHDNGSRHKNMQQLQKVSKSEELDLNTKIKLQLETKNIELKKMSKLQGELLKAADMVRVDTIHILYIIVLVFVLL